jgi:hypothetical protein
MTHYVHRIEKHVLKYIVTYDDNTFDFFFWENNNDVYVADKKMIIFFTKNFDNDANTVNAYEKIVVIISCNRRGEDKTL